MTPADVYPSPRKRKFRVSPAVILTLAVVAALALFARTPAGAPAAPWETVVQKHYAPAEVIDAIVPSPLDRFGPARTATGAGGR